MTDATNPTDELDLLNASDDDLAALGLPPSMTMDDLKTFLTDEEIARATAGDDPLVKVPEKSDTGDDDEGDDEAEAEDAASNSEDQAAAGEELTFTDDVPDPTYEPRDVSAAKTLIETAAAERAKLREQWNDGDLTDAQYDEHLDALNDKITDAKVEVREADREAESSIEQLKQVWFGKVDRFLAENPEFKSEEAVDKLGGDSYLAVFDKALRAVSQDARYAGLSLNERIEAGARITKAYVKQQAGVDMAPAKAPAKAKDEADPLKLAREKVKAEGKRPDPVQTLGNVIAATETEAGNSRFDSVDRAEGGLAREKAFARLSPEEQEAYLQGA